MSKQEWKENKGRRPYTADVLVDVQLRSKYEGNPPIQREAHPAGSFDWTIEEVPGDILSYRKSEIQNV